MNINELRRLHVSTSDAPSTYHNVRVDSPDALRTIAHVKAAGAIGVTAKTLSQAEKTSLTAMGQRLFRLASLGVISKRGRTVKECTTTPDDASRLVYFIKRGNDE